MREEAVLAVVTSALNPNCGLLRVLWFTAFLSMIDLGHKPSQGATESSYTE